MMNPTRAAGVRCQEITGSITNHIFVVNSCGFVDRSVLFRIHVIQLTIHLSIESCRTSGASHPSQLRMAAP